jgi:hypothetical protein
MNTMELFWGDGSFGKVFPHWGGTFLHLPCQEGVDVCKDMEGIAVTPEAEELLLSPGYISVGVPVEITLVSLSLANLGLRDGSSFKQICEAGLRLGYHLCPPDVGPHLRQRDIKQRPGSTCAVIMMTPLPIKSKESIFYPEAVFLLGSFSCYGFLSVQKVSDDFLYYNDHYRFIFRNKAEV